MDSQGKNHPDGGPWYQAGLRFECTRCGNCCGGAPGYVWVSTTEITQIADYRGLIREQFERQHVRRIGLAYSLLERENGDCEFLIRGADGLTGCAIHAVRPLQCRTWPFWESNLQSRRCWDATRKHCPGINRGEFHPLPVIEDYLARNAAAQLSL